MLQPNSLDLIPTERLFDELVKRHDYAVLVVHRNDGVKGLETHIHTGSVHDDAGKCDPRAAMFLLAQAQLSIARGLCQSE